MIIDGDHINTITKSAFWHLKNISKFRDFVSKQDVEKLRPSLPYRDFQKSIRELQLIQKAASRVSDHVTQMASTLVHN